MSQDLSDQSGALPPSLRSPFWFITAFLPCPRVPPHVPADGRFLLLPPCLGEQPSRDVEREALASQVRRVEEENQQLRMQLGQVQAEGSDGNPQWAASAEDGPPLGGERNNRTACPKQRMVRKCEVGGTASRAAQREPGLGRI